MSPIGSYVGGLTSKGQVGVLLGEHRGWILRMAALIKGRLSDNQTSDRISGFYAAETPVTVISKGYPDSAVSPATWFRGGHFSLMLFTVYSLLSYNKNKENRFYLL